MAKATRKIVTAPAATATPAKPVKPVIKAATVAAAIASTPAPVVPAVVAATVPAVAKPSANLTRTAATVVRHAANFAVLSDRDSAYLAFYAGIAKASATGNVTLAALSVLARNPLYAGSAKAHDAGVIIRLTKAGLINHAGDGTGFTFTEAGKTHGAYTRA